MQNAIEPQKIAAMHHMRYSTKEHDHVNTFYEFYHFLPIFVSYIILLLHCLFSKTSLAFSGFILSISFFPFSLLSLLYFIMFDHNSCFTQTVKICSSGCLFAKVVSESYAWTPIAVIYCAQLLKRFFKHVVSVTKIFFLFHCTATLGEVRLVLGAH